MSKSSSAATISKPKRPKDCPLFAHATGRWAKKIRGRLVYFGKRDDLDGALTRWAEQKYALSPERTSPRLIHPLVVMS
jgi:hypothetical protein